MSTCQAVGCHNLLDPRGRNRKPMWCSAKCRKTQYAQTCVDCGAPTKNGSEGRILEPRCLECGKRKGGETRTIWTRELLISRIREWAKRFGSPPAVPDWAPAKARAMSDDDRAVRFERAEGYWPSHTAVIARFGSWNAGMTAAGYTPRAPYGSSENQQRRRSRRAA